MRVAIDSISRKNNSYTDSVADFDYSINYFAGKNVILIEDVVSKGVAINSVARRLINLGATSLSLRQSILPGPLKTENNV